MNPYQLYHHNISKHLDLHKQLKQLYPDHVIILRVGDFAESVCEDAYTLSKCLNLVLTAKTLPNGSKVALSGYPQHSHSLRYAEQLDKAGLKYIYLDKGKVL